MTFFYPLAMSNWNSKEIDAIHKVIESDHYSMGQFVREFEAKVAQRFGSQFAVMVNSGSSANLLMLTAMKIKFGHAERFEPNIIVPAISWSTTYTPSYYLGYKLKFVDVSEGNYGINPSVASQAIDEHTVGIMAVNLLGSPSELDKLKQIADSRRILLLEDNCESLGASIGDRYTGSFGIMSSHSSFFSHHINTMEGGWVTTDDEELYEILKSLRAHGWTRELASDSPLLDGVVKGSFDEKFNFIFPGLNFRPLEMEAAIGLAQLEKIDEMLPIRRQNAEVFEQLFKQLEGVEIQNPYGNSSWFAFSLVFEDQAIREKVAKALEHNQIESRPVVAGNFLRQRVLRHLKYESFGSFEVVEKLDTRGMYLGNHPISLAAQIEKAWSVIREIL